MSQSYANIKVAGITIDIKNAKSSKEAKARWDRAKNAVDSLFAALENSA